MSKHSGPRIRRIKWAKFIPDPFYPDPTIRTIWGAIEYGKYVRSQCFLVFLLFLQRQAFFMLFLPHSGSNVFMLDQQECYEQKVLQKPQVF